jgi:PAS domain S-box-containing protein
MRDFFDRAAAPMCVLDGQNRIEYANASFRQIVSIADAEMQLASLAAEVRRSGTAQADVPLRSNDGATRWVLVSASLLRGEGDAVSQIACVMMDVTDRRQAEERLRHSEAQYRVLAETAEDHIFVVNRDDRVEYVNRAAARQFNATPEHVIGRRRTEMFPPDVAGRQGENLQRVFATGEPVYAEGRTMYLDREVWLGTWLVPVPDESGGVKAVLGLSRDMTAQRRSYVEASHAQRLEAIGRLAGGIAHDFNNTLAAILGYVEVMLEEVDGDSPLRAHLSDVQHAGLRAAGLVRQLLAFGRRQVLQSRDLSVNALVVGLTPMLQRMLGARITIDTVLSDDLHLVTADAGELEQIVVNLALNARDAMPDGGTLTIETANADTSGTSVRMTIRDTGAGIADDVKEHIFEPFFTTKPTGEGAGLGLSTVYGIVKQLDGTIDVDSEPGRGCAFHVYLPAATAARVAAGDTAAPAASPAPRRETILLVEDDDVVRRFAQLALERHGFQVLVAASPEQALLIASSGIYRPRVLLTDVVMPRMNGPELAAQLTRMLPDLVVLYMSGYSADVLGDNVPDASIRLIAKPFNVAQLVTAIDELLGASGSPS